ncbi:MAG: hypothetical protein HYV26_01065, partial [Candidatus Hydrogenedentes bacterium]|nr:hypothetical protein [Candidatus Hydrogenedentota bacterium]
YSSNPEEIINAAQSSALFAIGGSMDVNLLDKLKRGDNATLYKADIAAGSHGSSFDNRTNDFIVQTAADKETVIAEMQKSGGLRSRIESRWATVLRGEDIAGKKLTFFQKDLLEQMDGAYDMFLKSALEQLDKGTSREEANDALFKAISKTDNRLAQAAAKLALKAQQENSGDPQLGLRIFSALDATVRFQSDLKARISMLDPVAKVEAELKKSGVTDEATIGAARDAAKALHNKILTDLDSVLQGEILGLIQQRKLVVDTFIAQMELLGDDLSPKAPASGS